MKASMTTSGDVKPWYLQGWPWLLIALPASAVVAGFITLWLAIRSDDGLVRDDYYKAGLAINQVLDREKVAVAMGLGATVRVVDAHTLEVRLHSDRAVTLPQRLHLALVHPTRVGRDREMMLDGSNGRFLAPVGTLETGRWQVQLEDEARTWRLAGNVQFPESGETNIGARPAH